MARKSDARERMLHTPGLLPGLIGVATKGACGDGRHHALVVIARLARDGSAHHVLLDQEGLLPCLVTGLGGMCAHPAASAVKSLAQQDQGIRARLCRTEGMLTGLAEAAEGADDAKHAAAGALAFISLNKELRAEICAVPDLLPALAAAAASPGEAQATATGTILNCGCKDPSARAALVTEDGVLGALAAAIFAGGA
eukprot:CAMPEP_0114543796 /NCGR_PEP_ID=MMETSP0114-20121206/2545_1 /TAXON_ID=31324 /ORGANISM="Goniomonas sp, Strain m" /LENGTH=196 /DNA_ID=CAMNT_0001728155 /DNA_START=14 /DNA_END=601 /DNA_ORIENTATION=-